LTISPLFANVAASSLPMLNLTQSLAFMMEEGAMMVEVEGYEGAEMLVERDVLFVPKHTGFKYWAARPFTKALYVTGGDGGLDEVLMSASSHSQSLAGVGKANEAVATTASLRIISVRFVKGSLK